MPFEIDTAPVIDDTFLSGPELPERATFYPLGFPLELSTNSRHVIRAAARSWEQFSSSFSELPISINLAVLDNGETELPPQPKFRTRGHLMSIVSDAHNQVICDFALGGAFGWVTEAVARNEAFLRQFFLEAAVLSVLDNAYLAPIHGALVEREGRGILFCGESSAGKSTLSYACARAGWTFISDDGSFLVRNRPGNYAIGNPHALRLREDAKRLFPELADHLVATRLNGKMGMEVSTPQLAIKTAYGCPICHIIFLNRDEQERARLEPHSQKEALNWFKTFANYGELEIRQAQHRAYQNLVSAGVWKLHYYDLKDAIRLLEQLAQ